MELVNGFVFGFKIKKLLWIGMLKANDGVAKSDGGDVGGTWL